MKIDLLLEAKPIKKWPYKLAHKYKDIVKKEINDIEIIYPVDKSKWVGSIVIQPKNYHPKKLHICVDFRWLIWAMLIDPFPTPFLNEIINEITGHECYSFTDGFSSYNQVPITKEY